MQIRGTEADAHVAVKTLSRALRKAVTARDRWKSHFEMMREQYTLASQEYAAQAKANETLAQMVVDYKDVAAERDRLRAEVAELEKYRRIVKNGTYVKRGRQ